MGIEGKRAKRQSIVFQVCTIIFLFLFLTTFVYFFIDMTYFRRGCDVQYNSYAFDDWECTESNGKTYDITLPKKFKIPTGNTVTLRALLPDDITDNMYISFYSGRDFTLWIDGVERKEFRGQDANIIGGVVKGIYFFCELTKDDAGKEIVIKKTSVNNVIDFKEAFIGDNMGIVVRYLQKDMGFFSSAFVLCVFSGVIMIVGIILTFTRKRLYTLTKLTLGTMMVAMWVMLDSNIFQFVANNYFVNGTMSYLIIMLVPFPLISYLNSLQDKRYAKVHNVLCAATIVNAVFFFILHYAGIASFNDMLTPIDIVLGIICVIGLATIVYDICKYRFKVRYPHVAYGLVAFILFCIAEVISINTRSVRHDGVLMLIGVWVLLVFSVVQQIIEIRIIGEEREKAVAANAAKTGFVASMSHEIRTPLNSILGLNELIIRETDDVVIREYAEQVKESGETLLVLINDVLDISRIEAGKMVSVQDGYDTSRFVSGLYKMLEERAKTKKLKTNLIIKNEIPTRLFGDSQHIKQIITNFISNAVKYTNHGEITLIIERLPLEDTKQCRLSIGIQDTGVGIREEDQKRIFEKFTRVYEQETHSVEGTGLGLSVVRQLSDLINAEIKVESEYGEGSIFTCIVNQRIVIGEPMSVEEKEEPEEKANIDLSAFNNKRALVVDDNMMNRRIVEEFLKKGSLQLDSAESGYAALAHCEHKKYDIILMDHMMPEMDGIETLRRIRKENPGGNATTPIIALTANVSIDSDAFYRSEGFDAFLAKPISPKSLDEMILRFI